MTASGPVTASGAVAGRWPGTASGPAQTSPPGLVPPPAPPGISWDTAVPAPAGSRPPGPAQPVPSQVAAPQAGPLQAGRTGNAAAWTPNQVPSDPATLDQLAHRLYGRIRSQLAAELLADRERAHLLTDL